MAFLNKGLRITLTDERVQEDNEVVDDEIAGEAAAEENAEQGLDEAAAQAPQRFVPDDVGRRGRRRRLLRGHRRRPSVGARR